MHKCKDGSVVNTSELSKKHDLSSFFIDAEHGLLYCVNANDSDTLCAPAVIAANNESIRYEEVNAYCICSHHQPARIIQLYLQVYDF